MALTPPGKRLYVEIKCGKEILPELVRTLEQSKQSPEQTVLISFDSDVLHAVKKRLPDYRVLWLRGYDPNIGIDFAFREFIKKCREDGLDGVDLNFQWVREANQIRELKNAGLKVLAWTVDDPEIARRLVACGVEGITTNRPGWMKAELAR